jgi:hypothetical protein
LKLLIVFYFVIVAAADADADDGGGDGDGGGVAFSDYPLQTRILLHISVIIHLIYF